MNREDSQKIQHLEDARAGWFCAALMVPFLLVSTSGVKFAETGGAPNLPACLFLAAAIAVGTYSTRQCKKMDKAIQAIRAPISQAARTAPHAEIQP